MVVVFGSYTESQADVETAGIILVLSKPMVIAGKACREEGTEVGKYAQIFQYVVAVSCMDGQRQVECVLLDVSCGSWEFCTFLQNIQAEVYKSSHGSGKHVFTLPSECHTYFGVARKTTE